MWQLEHEWNLYGELFCCQAKLLNMQISIELTRFLPEQFRRATVNVTIALVISEWITVLHLFTPCSVVFSWNTSQISVNAAPHKHNLYISLNVCCNEVKWKWRMATHTQNLVSHMAPRGEQLGVRSLAQGSSPQSWYWGGKRALVIHSPTWDSIPQPSGYKYDSLTIRLW